MQLAHKGEKALSSAEGAATGTFSIGGALEIYRAAQGTEDAMAFGQRVLTQYWAPILIILVVVIASRYGKRILRAIKEARVEDARSGAHMGR